MNYSKILGNYKKTNVETSGKLDLIIMCYEKSIQFLTQAKVCLEKKDFEKKAMKMQRAIDIITELQCCLNMEEGGQIAANLDAIYSYIIKRLLLGDIKREITAFDECIHILSELKSSWDKIAFDDRNDIEVANDANLVDRDAIQIAA